MASNDTNDSAGPLEPEWLDPEALGPLSASPPPVRCWRCGHTDVPIKGRCPHCAARVAEVEPDAAQTLAARRDATPLTFLLFIYALFLLTSVGWGWVIIANRDRMTHDDVQRGTIVVEVIDSALVLTALAVAGRFPLAGRSGRTRIIAWTLGLPALGLLLGLNVAYGMAIREYIKPPEFLIPPAPELTLVSFFLICIQPAIVEELLCRYLALGVLARATHTATAVWVSAVMFAMAHIYNPLGLPYLFVAGVVFGFARVYGGLLLPMVLHFLHNFAVIGLEVMR
jgi:CAAX protease family protein